MTTLISREEIETMQLHTQYLQPEYVLRFPFAVVDATMHEHLRKQARLHAHSPKFKRNRLTDGSARYTLQSSEFPVVIDLAIVDLRAVASEKTYITCTLPPLRVNTVVEDHAYVEAWCKFFLILFIVGLWSDQRRMAKLDAISPTAANTHVLYDQETLETTLIIVPPRDPHDDDPINRAAPEPASVPPIPDPSHGIEHVLDWLDMYGATKGLNIDQVARKVGLAPKTLYNARHATGRTRKTGKRKN